MLHQRKHIRLRGFDYSSPNAYFITVCVQQFAPLLGTVRNGICGLSEIGNELARCLQQVPEHFPRSKMDEFIVMQNHFHCIVLINSTGHPFSPNEFATTVTGSVSSIIGQAKGAVTKWCRENRISFQWQPRFYDHVIRDNQEYWAIKNYIINNPRNWQADRFHM